MRPVLAATVAVCLVLFWAGTPAVAGPLGSPGYNIWHDPVAFSVSAGVGFGQRDVHVIDYDKNNNGRFSFDKQDELYASSFLTRINIAPVRFFDIYGLVGAADLQLDDGDYKGVLAPLWGGGLRPVLFSKEVWNVNTDFRLALDGQYQTWTTEDEKVTATMQEAQVALVASYVLTQVQIAPYGGFKYDYAVLGVEGSKNDMKGDIDYAVYVGADYFVTREVFFNVDLTIFSETRIFAGVGYKY